MRVANENVLISCNTNYGKCWPEVLWKERRATAGGVGALAVSRA